MVSSQGVASPAIGRKTNEKSQNGKKCVASPGMSSCGDGRLSGSVEAGLSAGVPALLAFASWPQDGCHSSRHVSLSPGFQSCSEEPLEVRGVEPEQQCLFYLTYLGVGFCIYKLPAIIVTLSTRLFLGFKRKIHMKGLTQSLACRMCSDLVGQCPCSLLFYRRYLK